jgi:hypothetical protein
MTERATGGRTGLVAIGLGAAVAVSIAAIISMGVSPTHDAAPSVVSVGSTTAYLAGCDHDAVVSPITIPIWCASTDQTLQDLSWTDWGAGTAGATGVFVDNPCDCDGGTLHRYPVAVELSHRSDVHGTARYERLEITFPKDRPRWAYRRSVPFQWSSEGFVSLQVLGS